MKKLKMLKRCIECLIIYIIFMYIHEFGHVFFALLSGSKVTGIEMVFSDKDNLMSLGWITRIDFNMSMHPISYILICLGGLIFVLPISIILIYISYKRKSLFFIIIFWIMIIWQFTSMLFSQIFKIGDIHNLVIYLDYLQIQYNSIIIFIIILILNIVSSLLLFRIIIKLSYRDEFFN